MPPKKSAANGDGAENGGYFKWEGPNDAKLLLLTQGRWVKPDEYPQLSSAFPGTSTGSIRNRISALRVKQRDLYLELNWDLPEGAAGHSAKKNSGTKPGTSTPKTGTPKKRAADADAGEEEEAGTPSKKPRARKAKAGKKEKDVVEESLGEGGLEEGDGDAELKEPYIPMAKRVKEEVLDEEMV